MEKRRIIPAFLVLCVIFAIVPCPGAVAAGMSGVEVIGQTAMTQDTFTDLSIIGANSSGLIDAINGTKNPAQSIGEWIKGEWDNWLLRQQLTWGTVLNIAAAGARYTGNGDLLFNSQLSDLFTRFYNWLWDGEDGPNISENAETIPNENEGVTISDYNTEYLLNKNFDYSTVNLDTTLVWDNRIYRCSNGNGFFAFFSNGDYACVSSSSGDVELAVAGGDFSKYRELKVYSLNGEEAYYISVGSLSPSKVSKPKVTTIPSGTSVTNLAKDLAAILFLGQGTLDIGEDQILGDPDKLGGLTGSERKRVAPPDIINFPDFGGNSGTIDVNDYLGGLRGAIESQDGTADVNITDSEGVESTQTMEIDQATDIPAETEATSDMVNQGELISTATPSTELADYTLDLRNYFPFCIPWDLYDMITILVAEPVAPRVQYPFVIEPLNVNYTIDLDFSQFDSVAAVLRTMELLAAGIGLALMTKRMIQGGD